MLAAPSDGSHVRSFITLLCRACLRRWPGLVGGGIHPGPQIDQHACGSEGRPASDQTGSRISGTSSSPRRKRSKTQLTLACDIAQSAVVNNRSPLLFPPLQFLFAKGAPESVLRRCSHAIVAGAAAAPAPLSDAGRSAVLERMQSYGRSQALRSLALAYKPMPKVRCNCWLALTNLLHATWLRNTIRSCVAFFC